MIQLHSHLTLADNTGAKKLRVILVHGGSKRRFGRITDVVTAAVEGAVSAPAAAVSVQRVNSSAAAAWCFQSNGFIGMGPFSIGS